MRRLPVVADQAVSRIRVTRLDYEEGFHARLHREQVEPVCRKGCSNCCHHPLAISFAEGVLLYLWLSDRGLWTADLQARLTEHSTNTTLLPPEVWLLASIPCPLLVAGECSAYKARPFACRTLVSTGDPDLCGPGLFSLATPLIERSKELAEFELFERDLYAGLRIHYRKVPLSTAVLVGASIVRGESAFEDGDREILKKGLASMSRIVGETTP